MRQEQAESRAAQNLQDAARQSTTDIEARLDKPLGVAVTLQLADYQTKWGDLARLDPAADQLNVTLPQTDLEHVNHSITVKHEGLTGSLKVWPASTDDTIDSTTHWYLAAGDLVRFTCVELGKWVVG